MGVGDKMDYELKFMVWPLRLYIANFYITEPVEVVFVDNVICRQSILDDIGYGIGPKLLENYTPFSFPKEVADKFINKASPGSLRRKNYTNGQRGKYDIFKSDN